MSTEDVLNRAEEVVLVPIGELIPHPKNMNKHTEDQINRLVKLIKYQGMRNPIIVQKGTSLIVAGHGRLEALKKMGAKKVPVIYQEFEDEAQLYAYMVSDNAINSNQWGGGLDLAQINTEMLDLGPDFDIDMLGIKDFVIEPIEKFEPQSDEDHVPEVQHPITRRGDIWILGNHRLMCGDSTMIDDVEKLMNGEVAELCFTSPPYSDQREYNGNKELSTEHIAKFISTAYGKAKYFAVNLGYARKDGEVNCYWDDYIIEAKNCGLKFLSWNIWNKGECGSIGNQSAMFGISHEWIFVFGDKAKELNKTVENKSAGARANHTGNRQKDGSIKKSKERIVSSHSQLRTVYDCTAQKARDWINHPARFSVEFAEGYIEAMTVHGHLLYEPFTGSGTTIIAAEKNGRKCYGMELDEKYCDVVIKRWEGYTGKKAVLELTNQTYEELKAERNGDKA